MLLSYTGWQSGKSTKHTLEATQDNKCISGDALFTRWKLVIMQRIIHDFHVSNYTNKQVAFTRRIKVAFSWFVYDPGTEIRRASVSFSHHTFNPNLPTSPPLSNFLSHTPQFNAAVFIAT
ncbi:hypothetical protein COEREDRAFT_85069 [Coemansia reversa NRRL 1564]|uniref:Uncharacterized protein n=1 Tax=Coemansia reversa (strain ATCC 12441 / NRRL 1564) TaxID=763665 RepID=A0A2G5BHY4_COERN|nr:hypothetical protein COEREDRAFT_85069 [Coemansia reversa NRRL 1564]|eukprot:PIA18591.1 hypothetical protein COEREDRAFT_85069 [Coemansia reversa NRRL 1564]